MGKEGHCTSRGGVECGTYEGQESSIQGFGAGPEGKRPLGRCRSREVDNIKINIQQVVWGVMYWMHLVKGRDGWQAVMNAEINLRDSKHSNEFLEYLGTC